MTKTENIVRSVTGPGKVQIRQFAYAADVLAELLYVRNYSLDDINLTRDVHPAVMKKMKKSKKAVEKSIQRVANYCLDHGINNSLWDIIGIQLEERPTPFQILVYFAYYSFYGKPYYSEVTAFANEKS